MTPTRTMEIRTPEGITFSLVVAGPVSRFLALLIDQLCVYGLSGLLATIARLMGVLSTDLALAAGALLGAVVSVGYPLLMEWLWRGRTLGKMALGLQVVDEQGLRLQPSQVIVRNLMRLVDMLPLFYGLGGLCAWLSPRGQRLGDWVANTVVVRRARPEPPDFERILAGKYNSFREQPHLAARLRLAVPPREAGVLLQALLRRDQLEDSARLELFAELRARLERAVAFPAEIADGLSDEQYVRNATDILFK